MRKQALSETLASWEQLLAGADANLDDLPALDDVRSRLIGGLAEVKAAHERQQCLKAEGRQATQDLRTAVFKGQEPADRFRSGVRLLYGRNAEKLAEFGMSPPRKPRLKAGCKVKGCPLEPTATAK